MAEKLDCTCGHPTCKNAGTYTLPGSCSNCGRAYELVLTKGHEAPGSWSGAPCPNCGCTRVGARTLAAAFAGDENQQNSSEAK